MLVLYEDYPRIRINGSKKMGTVTAVIYIRNYSLFNRSGKPCICVGPGNENIDAGSVLPH